MPSEKKLWVAILLFAFVMLALIQPLLMPPLGIPSLSNALLPFGLLLITSLFWKDRMFQVGLALVLGIMLSASLSNFTNDGITLNELLWSFRWLKLFTLLWAGFYLFQHYRRFFESMIQVVFLLMVLVNALQLMKIEAIIELYSSSNELARSTQDSMYESRLFGTMMNPNNNALVMSLFAVYFYFSRIPWKNVLTILAVTLILMTQSRTGILAVGLALVGSLVFQKVQFNVRRIVLIAGGVAGAVLIIWLLNLHYLSTLLDGTAFQSSSLLTRFDVVQDVLAINADSWILGQGKIASIPDLIGHSIDNELAYVYLEYGVFGTIALVAMIFQLGYIGKVRIAQRRWIPLLLVMVICGLTNVAFTNPECGVLFFVLFLAGSDKSLNKTK